MLTPWPTPLSVLAQNSAGDGATRSVYGRASRAAVTPRIASRAFAPNTPETNSRSRFLSPSKRAVSRVAEKSKPYATAIATNAPIACANSTAPQRMIAIMREDRCEPASTARANHAKSGHAISCRADFVRAADARNRSAHPAWRSVDQPRVTPRD